MAHKYKNKIVEVEQVPVIKGQVLPQNVVDTIKSLAGDSMTRNAYIAALRYKGWTLQAVGNAAGVTRERVRQIESTIAPSLILEIYNFPAEFPVPELPTVSVEKVRYESIDPSPETLQKLKELQPYAQSVRYNSSRFRVEAEKYTALLWHAHSVEKVTLYHLAQLLGVTHGALRFRLVRYGYLQVKTGKSRCYDPVKIENRAEKIS